MSALRHARAIGSLATFSGRGASDAVAHLPPKTPRRRGRRPRRSFEASPGSEPEIRALDEAIQGGRELGHTLGPRELDRGVVAVEDGVRRAERARRRVALEAAGPSLVRLSVDSEADDDSIVRATLVERRLADALDQHDDSVAINRYKSQAQRLKQELSLVRSGRLPGGRRQRRRSGYPNTSP